MLIGAAAVERLPPAISIDPGRNQDGLVNRTAFT